MEIIAEKNVNIDATQFIFRLARHPRAGLLVIIGQPADTKLLPNATPGEFVRCGDFSIADDKTLKSGSGIVARNENVRQAVANFVMETL